MSQSGYFNSPWPGEDGSASRMQVPTNLTGLNIGKDDQPTITKRNFWWDFGNMVVLGEKGKVYLLRANYLKHRYLRMPSTSFVELIHPKTLEVVKKSPRLKGGPMWPGGMAVHRNGNLYVVYGRYCHCLDADCNLLKSKKLPRNNPYNSFVILDNGLLVMKNFSNKSKAYLTVLDPETMEPVCEEVETIEPSIARLSAKGNTIYVVGVQSIFRYHFSEGGKPVLDPTWKFNYIKDPKQTYGWDVVLSEKDAWFLDNGKHRYQFKMVGAGVSKNPLNFIRVSLDNSNDTTIQPVSGLARGTVTNPPLFAEDREILIVYDSGNSVIKALKYQQETKRFLELWAKHDFGCSSHMIYYPDTGELCTNDYKTFHGGDHSVVLDIDTGQEKFRAKLKNLFQGVIFPAPGWDRDYYYLTLDTLMRVSWGKWR